MAANPSEIPTWDEVKSLPEMQNLSNDEMDQARQAYFHDVVKPVLPADQIDAAWGAFDEDTRPSTVDRVVRTTGHVARAIGEGVRSELTRRVTPVVNTARAVSSAAELAKGGIQRALNPSLDDLILKYGTEYGVDPEFIRGIANAETGHIKDSEKRRKAVSPAGAVGIMQLIPATAARFKVFDPTNEDQSVRGGTQYLRFLLDKFDGNKELAAAAYNAGEGTVDDYLHGTNKTGKNPKLLKTGGIPPFEETQNYVPKVLGPRSKRMSPELFGLPVTANAFNQVKAQYDAASPEERAKLVTDTSYVGRIARAVDGEYHQADAVMRHGPELMAMGDRLEDRMLAYKLQVPEMDSKEATRRALDDIVYGRPSTVDSTIGSTDFDFERAAELRKAGPLARGVEQGMTLLKQQAAGLNKLAADIGDELGIPGAKGYGEAQMQARNKLDLREMEMGTAPNDFNRNLEGAIASTISNVPTLAAGLFTGAETVPLLGMAAQVVGDEYAHGLESGQDKEQAILRALPYGAAEFLGEKLGFRDQVDLLRRAAGGNAAEFERQFVKTLAEQVAGEQFTTAAQFGIDKHPQYGLNPEATAQDYFNQAKDTLFQTILQTAMMGAPGGVRAAFDKANQATGAPTAQAQPSPAATGAGDAARMAAGGLGIADANAGQGATAGAETPAAVAGTGELAPANTVAAGGSGDLLTTGTALTPEQGNSPATNSEGAGNEELTPEDLAQLQAIQNGGEELRAPVMPEKPATQGKKAGRVKTPEEVDALVMNGDLVNDQTGRPFETKEQALAVMKGRNLAGYKVRNLAHRAFVLRPEGKASERDISGTAATAAGAIEKRPAEVSGPAVDAAAQSAAAVAEGAGGEELAGVAQPAQVSAGAAQGAEESALGAVARAGGEASRPGWTVKDGKDGRKLYRYGSGGVAKYAVALEPDGKAELRTLRKGKQSGKEAWLPLTRNPFAGTLAEAQAEVERRVGAMKAQREPVQAAQPEAAPEAVSQPVDSAAHEAAASPLNDRPEPTPAQKEAGNYRKGHVTIGGLDISIENPHGSTRSGVDRSGKPWSVTMRHHYGYIRGTVGKDKDHVDVFVKPGTAEDYSGKVFVIDQEHPGTGQFDEHKALIGFDNAKEAWDAYHANYAEGWRGAGNLTEMDMDEFRTWAKNPEETKRRAGGPSAREALYQRFGGEAEVQAAAEPTGSVEPLPEEITQPDGSLFPTKSAVSKAIRERKLNPDDYEIWQATEGGWYAQLPENLRKPNVPAAKAQPSPVPESGSAKDAKKEKKPGPLGLQAGDRIRLRKDVGYATTGDDYEIESTTKREIYLKNTRTGSRTSVRDFELKGKFERLEQEAVPSMAAQPEANRAEQITETAQSDGSREAREVSGNGENETEKATAQAEVDYESQWKALTRFGRGQVARQARFPAAVAERISKTLWGYIPPANQKRLVEVGKLVEYVQSEVPQAQATEKMPRVNNQNESPALAGDGESNQAKAEIQAPASTDDRFANNKLFTADKVAAARERLKKKLGTLNSGIDPELLIDGMTLAGAYIESGVRAFGEYAKLMVTDLGDGVKPYLLSFWEGARNFPGLDTKDMTSVEDSRQEHAVLLEGGVPEEAKEAVGEIAPKPKRKPKTGKPEDMTLTQDWGVEHIDAYSDEGEQVKAAFLKENADYLKSAAKLLGEQGFVAHDDAKGRPGKPVNIMEGGIAVSGDVSLTLWHPETGVGVYATIGGTSLRGVVPTTPSGVSLMARATRDGKADRYAVNGGNRWLSPEMTVADLARELSEQAEALARATLRSETKEQPNAEPENIPEQPRPEAGDREADRGAGRTGEPDRGPVGERLAEADTETGSRGPADRGDQAADAAGGAGQAVRGGESLGGRHRSKPAVRYQPSASTVTDEPVDHAIEDTDRIGEGGQKTKYRHNVAAIRLVKQLDAEGRRATPEEQKVLAKYVGWGGIKQAFDPNNKDWVKEYAELRELLDEQEYNAARRSMLDAHYTSSDVVKAMWEGFRHLGFSGGTLLEPSIGVGNFIGLMPAELRGKVNVQGVELDKITGAIVKQLYPKANIAAPMGFQEAVLPANSLDAAIGNPPFGQQRLYDANHPEFKNFSIHNFFFAKTLDKLRPGGVMGMVVSRYLMDAIDPSARQWLAERAQLLGAVRLPYTAFLGSANTEVVTDILFFQKLKEGETADTSWTGTGEITLTHPKTGEEHKYHISRYFLDNPRHILGNQAPTGKMQAGAEYNVEPVDVLPLNTALRTLLADMLPANVYEASAKPVEALVDVDGIMPEGVRVYGFFMTPDGQVMRRTPDYLDKRQGVPVELPKQITPKRMKGLIGVRDALRALMRAELSGESSLLELDRLRQELNDTYNRFRKEFGFINSDINRRAFADDPDLPLLESLEPDYDKGVSTAVAEKRNISPRPASAKKADIFTKRVLQPFAQVSHVESAKDALIASLNERGTVDPMFMAQVYGKPWEEMRQELAGLVYRNPDGGYESAEEYLSGNVKFKLERARAAAEDDPQYRENVEALDRVQPAFLPADKIFVKLGSPWVPGSVISDFTEFLYGGESLAAYVQQTAKWFFESRSQGDNVARTSTYGTEDYPADKIIDSLLTMKPIVVKENVGTRDQPRWVVKEKETDAARAKADEIAAKFKEWIWMDPERREQLETLYNDKYNVTRRRTYDGSHLTLPGANPAIQLRPHQKAAVWRGIQDRIILLDHVVGAGKTFEMTAMAMELRRLGVLRKPMFLVPKHLIRQWRDEFYKLYPNANVLAATEKDFEKANRKRLFARIATGDWDAVIVGHSSFTKIGMPHETERRFLEEQVQEIADAVEEMKRNRGDRNVIKDMERIKEKLNERLKALANTGPKDDAVTFDELGVDGLFVDEAHLFKNLFFYSQMQNVAGLGSPSGSQRAFDLFIKTRYLQERFNDRGVTVFATGTPVSNSLVEMYTMQRYLMWPEMKRLGIHLLDAWAGTFGDVQNVYEVHPSGTGYRLKERFQKFANIPGLMDLYRKVADSVTMDDLKRQAEADGKRFPVPKVKGGKPQLIVADRSERQTQFFGVPEFMRDESGGIVFKYPDDLRVGHVQGDDKYYILSDKQQYLKQGPFETKEEAEEQRETMLREPMAGYNNGSILWKFENLKELTRNSEGKINALSVTNEARKAGLDYRLIDPAAADFKGSKINLAVKEILRIHKAWAEDRGAQLVFCDLSVPKSERGRLASKEQEVWVRDGNGGLKQVKATIHAPEGFEGYVFYVVQTGKGDKRQTAVYDAVSGALVVNPSPQARADLLKRLDEAMAAGKGIEHVNQKREQYGELTEDQIADWKAQQEGEEEGDEAASDEDKLSLAELLAVSGGNAGFSVYDDIKEKLIKAGIPANEVAFIHDYDTAVKKAELFAAVRKGDIRVLLGSTEKMGAGMNVQERLVALHHLDAPWRPSDLEQREGRIVRQGNALYQRDPDGFEVEVLRYATKQTYDTRMWQILEHKASGVEQLRKAGDDVLELEDIGGEAANAADMKAAASGNPLILDEIRLRNEVKSLEGQEFGHRQAIIKHQNDIRWARGARKRGEEAKNFLKPFAMAAERYPVEKDKFHMAVDGKDYSDRKEAGKAFMARIAKVVKAFEKNQTLEDTVKGWAPMGTYRGADIWMSLDRYFDKSVHMNLAIVPPGKSPGDREWRRALGDYNLAEDDFSFNGFVTRLNNGLDKASGEMAEIDKEVERQEAAIPRLEELAKQPFAKAEELTEARRKHRAIVSQLAKAGGSIELTPEMRKELDAAIKARLSGAEDVQYSQSAGSGSTIQSVVRELADSGFASEVYSLVKRKRLRVEHSRLALPGTPKTVTAVWDGRHRQAIIYYDRVRPGEVVGKVLHELGEHASFRVMLGDRYADAVSDFETLLASGNPWAKRAAERADSAVRSVYKYSQAVRAVYRRDKSSEMRGALRQARLMLRSERRYRDSERLAYLIEMYANADEKERQRLPGRVKVLIRRIIAAVRAWFFQSPFYQAAKAAGIEMKLSPADITALAREALRAQANLAEREMRAAEIWSTPAVEPAMASVNSRKSTGMARSFGGEGYDPDAPITVLQFREDPDMPNLADTVALRRYIKQKFQGKKYENEQTGYQIGVFAGGLEAALKNRNTQARRLYAMLPELLEKSVFAGYTENTKLDAKPNVVGYETYYAAVEIGGKPHSVRVLVDLVKDEARGRGYYYHQIKELDLGDSVGKSRSQSGQDAQTNYPESPRNVISLRQILGDIKEDGASDSRYSQDEDRATEDAYDRLSRITDKSEFRRAFEALDDTVRRQVLGAFTRDQLGDIAYPILPEIKDEYLKTAYKLDADRNEIHHKVGTFMEPYAKLARKDRAEADRMADVMHEATLAGVDPAVRYQPVINIKEGLAEIRKIKAKATANKALTEQDVARINELTRTIKQELRRKEVYTAIKAKYDALSDQSKDIYREIRDYHVWFDEQLQDALEKRIEESDASPKAKREMLAKLREMFESNRVTAPYFPLARFGGFWVNYQEPKKTILEPMFRIERLGDDEFLVTGRGAADNEALLRRAARGRYVRGLGRVYKVADEAKVRRALGEGLTRPVEWEVAGDRYVEFLDSLADSEEYRTELERAGMKILGHGEQFEHFHDIEGVSSQFVGEVEALVSEMGANRPEVKALQDEIWQVYLKTLPEVSARRHFIHRTKRKGFSRDALRANTRKGFHDGYQLARLRYMHILEGVITDLREAVETADNVPRKKRLASDLERYEEYQRAVRSMDLNGIDAKLAELNRKRDAGEGNKALNTEIAKWEEFRGWFKASFDPAKKIRRNRQLLESAQRIEAAGPKGKYLATPYVNELQDFHKVLGNPENSAIAARINAFGFALHLGANAASAIVNTVQTLQTALPMAAAKYGYTDAAREFARAFVQFNKSLPGVKQGLEAAGKLPRGGAHFTLERQLSGDELRALHEFQRRGTTDKTFSHDLAGVSEEGVDYSGTRYRIMKAVSWAFHTAERLNREVTLMAVYRLARQQGADHDTAMDRAVELTNKAHGNYDAVNRARWMRGNFARVALQFKQYAQLMSFITLWSWRQAFKGASAAERSEARRFLAGMLAVQWAVGGVTGLPLPLLSVLGPTAAWGWRGAGATAVLWAAYAAAMLALNDPDDGDELWDDFEAMWRTALVRKGAEAARSLGADKERAERIGAAMEHIISKGLADGLTPWSIAGRVSMSDLWWRTPDRDMDEDKGTIWVLKNLLGPVVGDLPDRGWRSASMAHEGWEERNPEKIYRAIEGSSFMPSALANVMKAFRLGMEGARDLSGNDLVKDVTPAEIIGQALGFQPARVAVRQELNAALSNLDTRLKERRQNLLDRVADSALRGDTAGVQSAAEAARRFGVVNPDRGISRENVQQSARARMRRKALTENGLYLSPKSQGIRGWYRFGE